MVKGDWNGVPLERVAAWNEVYSLSQEGVDLSASCPVCGSRTLHRYFLVGKPGVVVRRGRRYVASGAGWEWCSSCRSYVHFSGLVPEWWSSDLRVESSELTAEPEALERAIQRRGLA
jgi:hypothetical protein